MRRALAALLVFAALLAGFPAGAGTGSRTDPNDSPGRLDVRRILHRHAGGGILVHRVKTFAKWDTAAFNEGSHVDFSFFVNGGPRVDRVLSVSSAPDGTPYAEMSNAAGDTVGYGKVWKPTAKTLHVEFPKSLLGKKVARYRWKVETTYHQDGHPDCGTSGDVIFLCLDRAPNQGQGKLRHRLG